MPFAFKAWFRQNDVEICLHCKQSGTKIQLSITSRTDKFFMDTILFSRILNRNVFVLHEMVNLLLSLGDNGSER